jgi:hypothetical protein
VDFNPPATGPLGPATFNVSPASLLARLNPGASTDLTLTLYNQGAGPLSYFIAEGAAGTALAARGAVPRRSTAVAVPWLSESPSQGVIAALQSQAVDVAVNSSGLAEGQYQAYLVISNSDPAHDPTVVPVTAIVSSVLVSAPAAGDSVMAGSVVPVSWAAPDSDNVNHVDLAYTMDGGVAFQPIASGVPNSGVYDWWVPNTAADSCQLRVTAYYVGDSVHIGYSDPFFRICSPSVGAPESEPPPASLGLTASPNPFGERVRFVLSGWRGHVQARVFDLRGAVVRDLSGDAGSGGIWQVSWDGRSDRGKKLACGVYLMRCEGDGRRIVRKVVLAR